MTPDPLPSNWREATHDAQLIDAVRDVIVRHLELWGVVPTLAQIVQLLRPS